MSIERSLKGQTRVYIPTCDICGTQLSAQYVWPDAVAAEKNAGWKSKKIDGEWMDLCQDCQSIVRGEK